MTTMGCEQFLESIGELVDGTLDGAPRHALEAHLQTCAQCALLVEELLVVRRAARAMSPLALPPAAWARLDASISRRRAEARWRFMLPLAAAALLVLAVTGMLMWRAGTTAPESVSRARPAAGPAPTSGELAGSVDVELQQAEHHFENAVNGLEVLAKDRQALDPQVAAELQKNLQMIDQAIGESRAALHAQPMSQQAQESLFDAFRSKIALLQDTIALINEMRKGNQAEAARIAEGLNKS